MFTNNTKNAGTTNAKHNTLTNTTGGTKNLYSNKLLKLLTCLLFMLCLTVTLFAQDGTTQAARPSNWLDPDAGTEENPYLISNLANLRWLSENSNEWWQNESTLRHFLQTANIDASETEIWNNGQGFQPIGHAPYSNMFVGVYDGYDFIISNLFINRNQDLGLFQRIENSTIKNLNLEDIDYRLSSNGSNVGGLAAHSTGSSIINCSITGNINVVAFRIGGIIGYMSSQSSIGQNIQNSCSAVNIISTYNGTNPSMSVGGIVGTWYMYTNAINSIENSYSTGDITFSSSNTTRKCIGGIIGAYTIYSTQNNMSIINSFSTGNLSSNSNNTNVGGIVGYCNYENNNGYLTITNGYSLGSLSVTGTNSFVGGIVGRTSIRTTINNSYSLGSLSGTGTNSFVGGIVGGTAYGTTITNSYSAATMEGPQIAGLVGELSSNSTLSNSFWDIEVTGTRGIWYNHGTETNNYGLTTIEMKQASYYIENGWDFSDTWAMMPDINDGYPFLRSIIDIPAPPVDAPLNLTATMLNNSVYLSWDMPNIRTISSFSVYRDGDLLESGIGSTFHIDATAINNTKYLYTVVAVYTTHSSEPSYPFEIWTRFPVRSLTTTFEGKNVVLEWLAPVGGVVNGYRVYRNDELLTNNPITALTFSDENTLPGTIYKYQVRAVYVSGMSQPVEVSLLTPLYTPPTGLEGEVIGMTVSLEWVAPVINDDFALFTGYKVYRNEIAISGTLNDLFYIDTNPIAGFIYDYYVTAVYSEPYGESIPSNIVNFEIEAPEMSPPVDLEAVIGDGNVVLTWKLPGSTLRGGEKFLVSEIETDLKRSQPNLTGFNVYRNGVIYAEDVRQTRFEDTNVINQTAYSYYVTAVYTNPDLESLPSDTVNVTTLFPIRNLTTLLIGYNVKFDWQAPTGGGANGYNIYRQDALLETVTSLTFTDDNTTPGAEYLYQIKAVYTDVESPAITIDVRIPLFNPPRNLMAIVDKNNVELSWEMPEMILDFEVLLGYNIFRNGTLLTNEPLNQLTYSDNDLANGTYMYKIVAVYNFDGESVPVEEEVKIDFVSDENVFIVPVVTELRGNYPNPFNPETVIEYSMATEGYVSIDVFNIRGQKIRTLVDGFVGVGKHSVVWNGKDDNGREVVSGIYLYVMIIGEYRDVQRMVLMK